MKSTVSALLVCFFVFQLAAGTPASADNSGSSGTDSHYRFDDWQGPPIDVRVYSPVGADADTSIVFVIHGWSRDVERYYGDWEALADQFGFTIVVPHFPVDDFPGSNEFNQGHVFERETGSLREPSQWTFAAIEALFDDVVDRLDSSQTEYVLYGHSAGSQFVHRYLWYMPEARVGRYLAANAGWYTLPDFDVAYPYGLQGAAVSPQQVATALAKDVVLLLGREDVKTQSANLRNTPEAKAQGPNRYVRGLTMFETARAYAEAHGVEFNWRLEIVDDAGHVNAQMATAAAKLVTKSASPTQ